MTVEGASSATGPLLALLLAALALSGCAAGDAGAPAEDGGPSLTATATTGVLRGVVVDQAIRPVGNATVTARGPDGTERTGASDAEGFFGFANLVPGTWFVEAQRLAYTGSQTNVEVVAGVDDPPLAKLLLEFNPGELPFYTAFKAEAFVQCIIPGANMCAIINLYPCALAGYCEPIVDDTSHIVLYDHLVALQRTPDWLQTEVVWESTQSLSPALAVRYSAYSPDDGAGLDERQARERGPSPLIIRMDNATMAEWETGTAEGVGHEIFGHMDATSAIGSLGFVLNQKVTFYSHTFYGYQPPETWTFSAEGAVPAPPT